jgi:spermidine synthase
MGGNIDGDRQLAKSRKRQTRPKSEAYKVSPSETDLTSESRAVFLCATTFVTGAAVMIIELAGNRVLAPWFGNSIYTWTGLIGVILISISCGYYLGGYLADRRPDYVVLAHLLSASAVLTILTPVFWVGLEKDISSMNLFWGPVLASLFLFAVPGCLLASVSPFAVRLISLLSGDRRIGISAGIIGMLSTLGSVAGTFLAGFVLISHLHLKSIFISTGVLIAVLALTGYLLFSARIRQNRRQIVFIALGFLIPVIMASLLKGPVSESLIFEKTTFYNRVRVTEQNTPNNDKLRLLTLDTSLEGGQYLRSKEIYFEYQRYWELAKVFCPNLKKAAFLGGGAFTMPEAMLDAFPEAEVDVMEIDPTVIKVGRRFFRVDKYPGMNVYASDARHFLARTDKHYDFIFGDAYNGDIRIPSHMVTVEFFGLVKRRLSPDGVYMMHLISAVMGEGSCLFHSMVKTLLEVFKHVEVYLFYPDIPEVPQSIILAAGDQVLHEEALLMAGDMKSVSDLLSKHYTYSVSDLLGGVILSDQKNPLDYFIARSIRKKQM